VVASIPFPYTRRRGGGSRVTNRRHREGVPELLGESEGIPAAPALLRLCSEEPRDLTAVVEQRRLRDQLHKACQRYGSAVRLGRDCLAAAGSRLGIGDEMKMGRRQGARRPTNPLGRSVACVEEGRRGNEAYGSCAALGFDNELEIGCLQRSAWSSIPRSMSARDPLLGAPRRKQPLDTSSLTVTPRRGARHWIRQAGTQ
jgi:hypothetical protein